MGHCEGYFLDVLGGGGEQTLAGDGGDTPETGVAMAVQLLGVGATILYTGIVSAIILKVLDGIMGQSHRGRRNRGLGSRAP